MEQVNTIETARVETFPRMNWGAIVGGWMIALGIGVLLHLGGLAIGLASIHAHAVDGSAKAIALGAAVWTLLTWAGALFVGGMFASWFEGRNDTMMGAMHGLGVWGLTITMTVILLVLAGNHAHRDAVGGPMGGPMHAPMMMEHGGRVGTDAAILHAQLVHAVRHDGGEVAAAAPAPDAAAAPDEAAMPARGRMPWPRANQSLRTVEVALVHGDNAGAKAMLIAEARVSDADADRIVQSVMPQVDKTRADAAQAAADAAHHAAAVAAITFLAGLFSLLTALLGGWVGANHVHRIYHLRTYTRTETTPLG